MHRINNVRAKTGSEYYTVVKFVENYSKIFDCIPDNWFTNEDQDFCYWPPPKGKNVAIKALKQERPDHSWKTYQCEVVKTGFATYSSGREFVRQKILQAYNTSSAEEQIEAAKFRRQHPVLSNEKSASFENVFTSKKVVPIRISNQGNSASDAGDESNNSRLSIRCDASLKRSSKQRNRRSRSRQSDANSTRSNASSTRLSTRRDSSLSGSSNQRVRRSRSRQSNANITRSNASSTRLSTRRDSSLSGSSSQRVRRSRSRQSNANSTRSNASSTRLSTRRDSSLSGSSSQRVRRSRSRQSNANSTRSNASSARLSTRRDSSLSGSSSQRVRRSLSRQSNANSTRSNASSTRLSTRRDSSSSGSSTQCARRSRSRQSNSNRNSQKTPTPLRHGSSVRRNQHQSQEVRSIPSSLQESSNSGRQCSSSRRFNHSANQSTTKRSGISKNDLQRKNSPDRGHGWVKNMLQELRDLTKTVVNYQHQNDRRMTRIEVSINKTLVRLGDITRLSDAQSIRDSRDVSRSAELSRHEQHDGVRRNSHGTSRIFFPNDKKCPELPITSLGTVNDMNNQLKDKKFHGFLVNREKLFCMPSKDMTTNRVITAYLKRFISVRVRSLLTLKQESKDGEGFTLFGDFKNVYDFLISVILEAHVAGKTSLTEKEAHESLRIVWGRSKQLLKDEKKKKNQ